MGAWASLNNIMKLFLNLLFTFVVTVCSCAAAVSDPVADYLKRQNDGLNFVTYRGGPYCSDDAILRFDVDLNQDGQKEVLISSTLESDGKQGNVFRVYKQASDGFEDVGSVTLPPQGFYLGQIDDIDSYGIVKFATAGGGEGAYKAYFFDGDKIIEKKLGSIERNKNTLLLEGKGIENTAKYSLIVSDLLRDQVEQLREARGILAPDASKFISEAQIISSKELADKYGVIVESTTYLSALQSDRQGATQALVPPSPVVPATTPQVASSPIATAEPTVSAKTMQSPSSFPITPAIILGILILGVIVFLLRRKRM